MSTSGEHLFDAGPSPEAPKPVPQGRVRFQRPERRQREFRPTSLEELLPAEHRARLVWEWVAQLDLTPLDARYRAREGHSGRPPIDPRILMSLWLYATLDGVGSARHLDRLCAESIPYQWICGGVSVNYHTLADFRVDHEEFLDDTLTESIANLIEAGLVTMELIAQDGKRVPASAGSSSARSPKRIRKLLNQAYDHVEYVKREIAQDPGAGSARQRAARKRAARERKERIARAKAAQDEIKAAHDKMKPSRRKKQKVPRTSTTDPECRMMKLGNGGFSLAYNVQFATDRDSYLILGMDVVNQATDYGQISAMADQLEARYKRLPKIWLADKGYEKHACIRRLDEEHSGCRLYVPERTQPSQSRPYAPAANDSAEITRWKTRMQSEEAEPTYAQRAAVAECVNAQVHNRGMHQFRVRGRLKVRASALWHVLAHNLMRSWTLKAA